MIDALSIILRAIGFIAIFQPGAGPGGCQRGAFGAAVMVVAAVLTSLYSPDT
jgi:hypothetical protein